MSFDGTAVVLNQMYGSSATGLFVSTFWVVRGLVGAKRRRKQADQFVRFALQERECCFLYLRTCGRDRSASWSKGNDICRHWRHGVLQAELQPDVAVHIHSGLLWGLQCQGFAKWDASCKQVKVVAMRCLQSDNQCLQLQQSFWDRRELHPEPVFSEDEEDNMPFVSSEESSSSSESCNDSVTSSMRSWCSSLPAIVAKEKERNMQMRSKQCGSRSFSVSFSDSEFVLNRSESSCDEEMSVPVVKSKEVSMLKQQALNWYIPVKLHEKRARIKHEVDRLSNEVDTNHGFDERKVDKRSFKTIAFKVLFGRIGHGDAYWSKYTVAAFWKSMQSHHFPKNFVCAHMHHVPDRIQCFDGFIHKCDVIARLQ